MNFDVVIIGAGIVGAACACECARAGLRTAVIENGVIGGGATAQGMGHIVVLDDSEAQFALNRYSQTLWDELAEELPRDVEFDRCGTVWVAADEEEMAEARRKRNYYTARGLAAETLDERQLAEAEPNLRAGLAGALLVPGDSVIYSPRAASYLIEKAQSLGAQLILGKRVIALSGAGVKLSDGEFLAAGATVNATGSWAPELTPGIDVQKRKGHLAITDRYPSFVRHQLMELGYLKSAHTHNTESVAFIAQPRKTGQILIGSSRQFGVEHSQVEARILSRVLQRAIEYLPTLAELAIIRTWAGFRAATADHLPLIGPCSGDERLYLATGHEGLGITTSLGTAKLLVDQLLKRTPAIPLEPYLPARAQTTKDVAHA